MEGAYGRDSDHSPIVLVEASNIVDHEQWSQEFNLSGTGVGGSLDWLVGAYWFQEEGSDSETVRLVPELFRLAGIPLSKAGTTTIDNTSWALFGQATWAATEQLRLTAGLRYSYEEKDANIRQFVTDIQAPPIVLNPNIAEEWDDFTPKFSVEYDVTDAALVYGSVSWGFKSGGFTGRYIGGPASFPEPLSYDPEEVITYEVGLKSDWLDNRLRLNASGFFSQYDNIQVVVFQGPAPQTRNVAEGQILGLELEATAQPVPSVLLNATLGWIDAEYTEIDIGNFVGVVPVDIDNDFVNTPEWSFTLGGQYTAELGAMGRIVARADYSWQSETANDAINTASLIEDSYGILDLRADWHSEDDRFTLGAYIENVTDEEYIVSGNSDLQFTGFTVANISRGQEWGLRAKVNF